MSKQESNQVIKAGEVILGVPVGKKPPGGHDLRPSGGQSSTTSNSGQQVNPVTAHNFNGT